MIVNPSAQEDFEGSSAKGPRAPATQGKKSGTLQEAAPIAPTAVAATAPAAAPGRQRVHPPASLFLHPFLRRAAFRVFASLAALGLCLAALVVYEAWTSRLQAKLFTATARRIFFDVRPGASDRILFPDKGPSDERRGYVRLPDFTAALRSKGFRVESQARFSDKMLELAKQGIYPTYPDKTQAGLRLLDAQGRAMFATNYPLRTYPSFDSIPSQIVNTLLYIENRSLLDSLRPRKNPAVEWSRLGRAVGDLALQKLGRGGNVAGGSTLATQMEKYKHAGDGLTLRAGEKFSQMISASLRSYQHGENTMEARRRILLEYVNTVPLAALPGYGEVNGLSDGLLAWYGTSLDTINRQLRHPRGSGPGPGGVDPGLDMAALGKSYRQVLNLFIAHRRPSSYLLQHRDALNSIGENYLRVLGRDGVISPQLRDAALQAKPELMRRAAAFFPAAFVDRKHVNAVRARLTGLLGLPRLYDLDRLDLTVGTTLDGKAQKGVVQFLKRLSDRAFVDSVGLNSFRLLDKGDPSQIVYSFTLYESVGGRNLLRVQADNYDQPLNINEGVKLDLGSTAKLRTLVNYLEIISEIHARLRGRSLGELRAAEASAPDRLTQWTAGQLASAQDTSLAATLRAAMERKYSGDTREKFFTGGGVHRFVNFEANEGGVQTISEAFRHSVNLVFVRLMRDIVNYYIAQAPVSKATLLDSAESPARQRYLARFAEQEGQLFLGRFYRKYRDLDTDGIRETFFHGVRPVPRRLAAAYLAFEPSASREDFSDFLREQMGDSLFPQRALDQLYDRHFQDSLGLADLGFTVGVHPLELWLAGYLRLHPKAPWSEVKDASRDQIQETYQWLFKTRHKPAQDLRIRSIMEMEAFLEVHRAWSRLGYPFGSLVPSYATAIGSSADRPNALAELVGIILNDGERHPPVLIDRLLFAENTPYQTLFAQSDTSSRRLLSPELCATVKTALLDVVEHGTAVRGYKAFPLADGTYLPLGGKTGTGDQRFETFGKGGQLLESRTVNRTATFVFFLGDRFFGTITAHVHGERARQYDFTSALPVQLLKLMGPSLMPLLAEKRDPASPDGVTPVLTAARVRPGGLRLEAAGAYVPMRPPAPQYPSIPGPSAARHAAPRIGSPDAGASAPWYRKAPPPKTGGSRSQDPGPAP
jgi:membrane peptidoglycan carboxypeptidase